MVSALRNACVPLIALSLLLSLTRCDRMVYPVDEEMVTNIIQNLEKETEPVEEPEPEGEVPVVQKPEEPVLYASYPFNGNADDASGNGHNATAVGPSLTSDRFGNENSAYLFDGEDDYIILHYLPYFPGGNSSRSITGWFNSIDTEADIMMLFGFGYPDTTYNFQVGIGPNYKTEQNEFRVNAWGDTFDWRTGVTSAEYLDGKWHHVAVTYDGEVTMFYIDGILGGTTSDYQYYTDSENSRLVIGREIDLDEWEFNGVIDDTNTRGGSRSGQVQDRDRPGCLRWR